METNTISLTTETEQPEDQMDESLLGKYGMMRLLHLRKNDKHMYISLMMTGKLKEHLLEIDREATRQVDEIVRKMAEQNGTNEELKAKDQMAWVGLMNNYLHCAEEMVLPELIYS